jgi:hypothetical protein
LRLHKIASKVARSVPLCLPVLPLQKDQVFGAVSIGKSIKLGWLVTVLVTIEIEGWVEWEMFYCCRFLGSFMDDGVRGRNILFDVG